MKLSTTNKGITIQMYIRFSQNITSLSTGTILSSSSILSKFLLKNLANPPGKIYSSISHKEGLEFIDSIFQELDIKFEVSPEDLKRIPTYSPWVTNC